MLEQFTIVNIFLIATYDVSKQMLHIFVMMHFMYASSIFIKSAVLNLSINVHFLNQKSCNEILPFINNRFAAPLYSYCLQFRVTHLTS